MKAAVRRGYMLQSRSPKLTTFLATWLDIEYLGSRAGLGAMVGLASKVSCSTHLSGIVSCDAAAIRIWIRIVRCQRPAKRQKDKPCETQARFSSPLFLLGSKELVLKVPKKGQFHAAIRVTI